jgi:hypothetical protein
MTERHLVPPEPMENWRQVADAAPALAEPITIAEFWKNRRGEAIRLVLNRFEGRSIFDLRTWYTADGRLKPGKGFCRRSPTPPTPRSGIRQGRSQGPRARPDRRQGGGR